VNIVAMCLIHGEYHACPFTPLGPSLAPDHTHQGGYRCSERHPSPEEDRMARSIRGEEERINARTPRDDRNFPEE